MIIIILNGGVFMNDLKIQALQTKLNHMIDKDADFSKIYELSVKLDLLIVQYYNELLDGRNAKQ